MTNTITIVSRRETHSRADAEQLFNSKLWENISLQIDQTISKTHEQLALADEPRQIFRLQGEIKGLRQLKKIPEQVLASFPKGQL